MKLKDYIKESVKKAGYVKEDPQLQSQAASAQVHLFPLKTKNKLDSKNYSKQVQAQIAPALISQTQKGIELFQNCASSISKFDEIISELRNFAMRIMDHTEDESKIKELEELVNKVFSAAKEVSNNAKLYAEWAKVGWQETINDHQLTIIRSTIHSIRSYVDFVNIKLDDIASIKSWTSDDKKYKSLLTQLFGMQSKHNTPKQEGRGAIEIYKDAVNELIEAVKYKWPFDEMPQILNHLKKTVANIGNPKTIDFTKQLKRALGNK